MVKEATREKLAKNSLRLFFSAVVRWLVEPPAGVAERDRQKLRLLSAFLLLITINSLAGAIVIGGMHFDIWVVMLGITVFCAVGYGLSRTRYYKPALIIALCAPAFSVIGMVIIGADQTGIILSLSWLVLPFLLAPIFLARLTTIIVATSYLVFLAFLLPLVGVASEYIGEVLAFFLMVFFLVITIAVILKQDQTRVKNELAKRVKAEEKFSKAFRSSPNAMALSTFKGGKFLEVNDAFLRDNGYTREEVIGHSSKELGIWVKPRDRDRILKIMREKGRVIDAEFEARTKSGEVRTRLFSAEPIDIDGERFIIASTIDITERRQIGQALQKSEEKFSKAFRSSPDAMALSTFKDGKFLEVNDAFLHDYGYAREEVIGHSSKELGIWVKPKDRVRILRIMREKGRVIDAEFEARIKSGEIRTMLFSAEPIDIDGEGCIIASTNDITERKRLSEEIQKSEEKYRMIFESANDIIILLDNKGDIVDVNPKIGDIGGYSREQLVGKNFKTLTKIMPKKSVAIVAKNFMLRMLGVDVPTYEVEMYRGDGQKRNMEVSAVAVKDEGKVVGSLATLRDVTERHKAESALKYQRELIDQIIATTPNAVMVIDREMKVLLANDTFYKEFGLKKAGVENKPISEVIEEAELEQALSSTIKDNKKSLSFEFRYELKGVPRIFIATIVKMKNNRYLILIRDVTEEREKQERLYLTDRLASVGEMASGVAHELNNPLTSIVGLSKLLAKQDMPVEVRKDLMAINAEAQRCAAIVRNLLAFARKHVPKREPLPAAKVVEDVLKLRAYEQRSHNVTVTTDFADGLPEVQADYFQLQQVFLNIILNAETAMVGANGKGTLRITGERADGNIRISFSDDGPGIAKEHLGLIFNPFFTTKDVGEGTGLGLSISYGIVAAHGGRIYAKNNNDRGATFVVELPVVGN